MEDILDWEWGRISDTGDREKRPCGYKLFAKVISRRQITAIKEIVKEIWPFFSQAYKLDKPFFQY